VPLLAGGLLELPLGVLAGEGKRRRLAVLAGGIVFVLTLLGVASARSFAVLLCAFVAFYPAGWLVRGGGGEPALVAACTPVVALASLVVANAMWRAGIRRYHSTGS